MRQTMMWSVVLILSGCGATASAPGLADDALHGAAGGSANADPQPTPANARAAARPIAGGASSGTAAPVKGCDGDAPCAAPPLPAPQPGCAAPATPVESDCVLKLKACYAAEGGEACAELEKNCAAPPASSSVISCGQRLQICDGPKGKEECRVIEGDCGGPVPPPPVDACLFEVKNCYAAGGGEKCALLEKQCGAPTAAPTTGTGEPAACGETLLKVCEVDANGEHCTVIRKDCAGAATVPAGKGEAMGSSDGPA